MTACNAYYLWKLKDFGYSFSEEYDAYQEKKKYYIENTLTDAIRELDAGYDHLEYHLIRHNTDEQEIVSICPKPRLQLDDKCIIVTANSLLYTAKAVMSALK